MALRFRHSIRLLPGIRINLTKRGASSVSIGRRGAHMTFSGKGKRTTIGAPGTGASYTEYTPYGSRPPLDQRTGDGSTMRVTLMLAALIAVFLALLLGGK